METGKTWHARMLVNPPGNGDLGIGGLERPVHATLDVITCDRLVLQLEGTEHQTWG